MIRTIESQVVASTAVDSHGEQLTLKDIESLFGDSPKTMPLHQHHDFSLPVCGELTNFRIVTDPEDSKNYLLVCDAIFDDEKLETPARGFSWSATCDAMSKIADPEFLIYLPFPHYNDDILIDSLTQSELSPAVGKWLKKGVETWLVAIVVISIRPFWETVYKEFLESRVKQFLNSIRNRWPKDVAVNLACEVPTTSYMPRPRAILVLPKKAGVDGLTSAVEGVEVARKFIEEDFVLSARPVATIKLIYDEANARYKVIGVDYRDGSHSQPTGQSSQSS
ncbi:MAG: hypothetical protein WCL32_02200 [Planctomycetota bacterium]